MSSCVQNGLVAGALIVALVPLALLVILSTSYAVFKGFQLWLNNKIKFVLEPREEDDDGGEAEAGSTSFFVKIMPLVFVVLVIIIIYLVLIE